MRQLEALGKENKQLKKRIKLLEKNEKKAEKRIEDLETTKLSMVFRKPATSGQTGNK